MNQLQEIGAELAKELEVSLPVWAENSTREIYQAWNGAVSYTHLTLQTIYSV